MDQKPNLATRIFGWIAIFCICMGNFFKFMYWPTASVLIILGSFTYMVFYLPLWYMSKPKEGNKLFVVWQFFTLFLTALSFVFKTLHWPGAGAIYVTWLYYLLIIVLPFAFVRLYKTGLKSLADFNMVITLILMGTLILGGITGSVSRGNAIASFFFKNIEQVKLASSSVASRNSQLYHSFEGLEKKANAPLYKKSIELRDLTDSTLRYLRSLRNHLVAVNESVSESKADSLSTSDMKQTANMTTSTEELCGLGYKPRSGKFSGTELKQVIHNYRIRVLAFVEVSDRNFIKQGINLNTESVTDEEGNEEDWVFVNFLNVPFSSVLLTLENIRYEILNAENQILSHIVNTASKQSGSTFASRIAELGTKLEDERKQREIEKLERQQENARLLLVAKNAEVEAHEAVTLWIVMGLVLCLVLIFYIVRSNLMRKKLNLELKLQKQVIEDKSREITDSIHYAKRIQLAILPPIEAIYKAFPSSFVLYKPKDVVSGDFYAFFETEEAYLIAAADCTGHGVPGAFMSMIGKEQLSHIIIEKGITQPSDILDQLHKGIQIALNQNQGNQNETRDGMDIVLCKIYKNSGQLEYAGANRPLWLIRKNEIIETKADKQAIGGLEGEYRKPFVNHSIALNKDDRIFLFSDGYADQFGGDKGKKYMLKNFQKLLLDIGSKTMLEQKEQIEAVYESWKSNHEQVDDVLVIGVKF